GDRRRCRTCADDGGYPARGPRWTNRPALLRAAYVGHKRHMTSANASVKRAGATAEQGAQRATHSKPVEWLTRFGFICYGVLHVLIAYLAVRIAFGGASTECDQSGAFKNVAEQP